MFSQRDISYIANGLLNPFYMDRINAYQQRLAFARVCVEMDAAVKVPRNVEIMLRNGNTVNVNVTIPWMPLKCSHCKIFGHDSKVCLEKITLFVKV